MMAEGGALIGTTCLLLVIVIIIQVFIFWFWIWAIMDCAKHENKDDNTKLVWILIIALVGVIGALIYYFYRIPQREREEREAEYERVRAIEYDERYRGYQHMEDPRRSGYSSDGYPLCPHCGTPLKFPTLPPNCPYCGVGLSFS